MQRTSADKSSRILLLGILAMLAIVMVLYFMKRSELTASRNELVLAKSQSLEIEETYNRKISDFQQQIQTLEQKVSTSQSQLTKCENQLVDYDKEIQRKVEDITNCNKQISSAEENMQVKQFELDDMKAKEIKMKSDIENLNSQLSAAHGALAACHNQASEECQNDLTKCQQNSSQTNDLLTACNARCNNQNMV